jgi:cobalt-zinc-cadmium efflux system protein
MEHGAHDHDHAPEHGHAHHHARDARDARDEEGARDGRAGHDAPHAHGAHDHDAELRRAPFRKLAYALTLTVGFCVVEAVAGFAFGSLALLADAGHMLGDSAALALALVAQRIALRSRTRAQTYGFRRAEVLAAFVNGVALGAAAIWIVVEALSRWRAPPAIEARGVLVTAVLGLLVNLASGWILAHGSSHAHNPNTRAALAHVAADAIGSVGAIVAAVLVLAFGLRRADVVVSAGIAVLLVYGAVKLVAQSSAVLMEGAPPSLDLEHLERTIDATPGVAGWHDLHAWTISEGFDAVSVHVVLSEGFHGTDVAHDVARRIGELHGVGHVTVQPERGPAPLIAAESLKKKGDRDARDPRNTDRG